MERNRLIILAIMLVSLFQAKSQTIEDIILRVDTINNPNIAHDILTHHLNKVSTLSDSIQGRYYYHLGIVYGMLYQSDSSIHYFEESLDHSKKSGDIITQIGALNGLGNVSRILSENEQAKAYFEEALNLAKGKDTELNKSWQSKLLGNIAGIFFELGDPESALSYSRKALIISKQTTDRGEVATNLIRLGYCYDVLNQPDSALYVNRLATNILENTGDSLGLIYQYFNIANIYHSKEQLEEATENFERAVSLSEKFSEAETQVGSLNALAEISIERGQFEKASNLLTKAISISQKNKMVFGLRRSYQLLYELNRSRDNWASAIQNLEKYYMLNDSIQKTETLKSIEEFKVKYETAEKEMKIIEANAEIERKERQQQFLLIILATVLILGTVAITLIIQRYKLKRALLSQEIDNLRIQINSIFEGGIKSLDMDLDQINSGLYKPLTEREYEILNAAISDKTNGEIAESMYLSVNTVKYHLRNVYEKLGVSNRKEALEKILSRP